MRILIPIINSKGTESSASLHFGHAPYFAIYDLETKKLEIIENTLEHHNAVVTPVDQLIKHKPDMVYVKDIGGRALTLFAEKGVKVKTGSYNKVKDIISNLDTLEEVREGCRH